MSAGISSRRKGQGGELECASMLRELTGFDVRRRVRQHPLDVDLEGLPGWAVEVKRAARADQYLKRVWWKQCAEQAQALGVLPVLLYRVDRRGWRCVWPAAAHQAEGEHDLSSWEATLTASPITWWQMVRLLGARKPAGVPVAQSGV